MRMFITMVLAILLSGMADGATYYLDLASTTGDGSAGDPWGSFAEAITEASNAEAHTIIVTAGTYVETTGASTYMLMSNAGSGYIELNGKTLTFQKAAGGANPLIQTASTDYCMRILSAAATGTLIFDGIDFTPSGASLGYGIIYTQSAAVHVSIKNCTITLPATCTRGLVRCDAVVEATRTITFEGVTQTGGQVRSVLVDVAGLYLTSCILSDSGANATFSITGTNISSNLYVTDCTISGGSGDIFGINTACGTVKISGGTYSTVDDSAGIGVKTFTGDGTLTNVIIENATFDCASGGVQIPNKAANVLIANNRFSVNHATAAGMPIQLGEDDASNSYPLGAIVVRNNTVRFDGADNTHGILIGSGCDGAEVAGNYIEGGDIQLVMKGRYCHVANNVLIGARPLYLKGCWNTRIHNNTCVASSGGAFEYGSDGTNSSYGNYVTDNIFVATGADAAVKDLEGAEKQNIIDYNSYAKGTYCGIVSGTNCADVAAMRTKWRATATVGYDNDQNSFEALPGLTINYQATNRRLKNAGSPKLIKSDGTVLLRNDIGATRFDEDSGRRSRYAN